MKIKKMAAFSLAGALMVSALSGCGVNTTATVATLGNQEISLGVANFMSKLEQASVDEMYRSYFGDDIWEQDLMGSGSSMQEDTKSSVMESLHEMYTLQNKMSEYQVSLSDEEVSAIQAAAEAFMNHNTKATLREMGATQEIVEEMLTLYTIQYKMQQAIYAEADTEVSDSEANMRAYTMVEFDTSGYYDSDYNYVTYTDEEIEVIGENAVEVYTAIEDPQDLETVAEEYGYSASNGTYDEDDDTLDESVKTALDALKEGEMSEVIATDAGYYIVRLDSETDEEATEQNRQNIIAERQDALYTETLESWQEEDGWTVDEKVLAKIQFTSAFTQKEETEDLTEEVTEVAE
jgi:foldase protein PrsA